MRIWRSLILLVVFSAAILSARSPVVPNADANNAAAEQGLDQSPPDDPGASEAQPTTVLLVASGLICFGMTRKFRVNR
ncbi:MAG TPA: hypothetical protein VGG72_04900 [Bryobacteraceae bacterium]|jgi:hypothetical protein